MEDGDVEEDGEDVSSGGEEAVAGDGQFLGDVDGVDAKEVDDESTRRRGKEEGTEVGVGEAEEVKSMGFKVV